MLKEFKEFVMRGNMMDMAVGIIIGVAFGAIVGSLVADVIMPPIGLALGKVDFANLFAVLKEGTPAGPYASLADAKAAGAVSINYGVFINTIINFLIIAFAVFLIVRSINRMKRKAEAPRRPSPQPRSALIASPRSRSRPSAVRIAHRSYSYPGSGPLNREKRPGGSTEPPGNQSRIINRSRRTRSRPRSPRPPHPWD